MILLFSIISCLLTILALIAFFLSVRKHYTQIFTEAFFHFIIEVRSSSDEDHMKAIQFINEISSTNCDQFSVEKYLIDTHHHHKNNSKYFAKLYKDLQLHKMKVIMHSLFCF
jgi:acyl-ACP thioesterase